MITLFDSYAIKVDEHNYTLIKLKNKLDKNGNEIYSVIGYYSSVKNCLKALYNLLQRNAIIGNKMTILDFIDTYDRITDEFNAKLDKELRGEL